MFCGKCGSKCDDDAKFCTNCGATIERAQPKAPQPGAAGPGSPQPIAKGEGNGKNKKRIAGIIAAAAIVMGIVFAVVNIRGARGYEETVEKFCDITFKTNWEAKDAEEYFELMPERMLEILMIVSECGMEELGEELRSEMNYQNMLNGLKDYKISYEILDAEDVTGSELDDVKEAYKDYDVRVSEVKNVRTVIKIEYKGAQEKVIKKLPVIKVGNSWYMDFIEIGGMF